MSDVDTVTLARRYLEAVEAGATGERLAAFFSAESLQEEFPNRLLPQGARRNLEQVLAGAERGQSLMASQRYEVLNTIAQGDWVALEVRWTGVLRQPVPGLPAGEMRARFGVFLQFQGGKIVQQRNYDCFDPW
jgi:ketosteroid isomerase-like protein